MSISLVLQDSDPLQLQLGSESPLTMQLEAVQQQVAADYEQLDHKPQINSVELVGNKSLDDLGAQQKGNYPDAPISNTTLRRIFSW